MLEDIQALLEIVLDLLLHLLLMEYQIILSVNLEEQEHHIIHLVRNRQQKETMTLYGLMHRLEVKELFMVTLIVIRGILVVRLVV